MKLGLAYVRLAWRGWFVGASLLLFSSAFNCTVFDGLTVPQSVSPLPGYLSIEQGIRACHLAVNCPLLSEAIARSIGVPANVTSYSTCMSWLAGPIPANRFGVPSQTHLLECVANAIDCSAALECVYIERLANDDVRCSNVVGSQCSTNAMLVDCTSDIAERCRSVHYGAGSECHLGLAAAGRCALATCDSQNSPPPRCTSGVYVRCDPATNLRVAKDCNTVGLTCPEGAEGADAQCATEDGVFPCDEPGRSVCSPDGSRARVCDGALASEFDCSAMDAVCSMESTGARCVRMNDTCAATSVGIDTCDGDVISLCVAGARISFDCATAGFSCKPPAAGRSGFCG